ncbi:MAG: S26 family signal peptidase, partial [Bdellovibrionota bacterium]
MQRKRIHWSFAAITIVVTVIIAIIIFVRKDKAPEKEPNIVTQLGGVPVAEIYRFDQDVCPGPKASFKNLDLNLRGYVEKDETVSVTLNWYRCHPPKVGEIVLYRFSWHREPVLKRIVATEGDRIDLVLDHEGRGWNLVLNDKVFESSGRRYFIGVPKVAPPLKLYADANDHVLKPGLVVVLSSHPPGENDSGWFGPVSIQDIVGIV